MKQKILRVAFGFGCVFVFFGWLPAQSFTDSTAALTLSEYAEYVQAYHPVLRQADLLPAQARQYLREARGAFDPTLAADFNRKVLKGTTYYDNFYSVLKVPTLPGLNLVAGFESSTGRYPSSETRTTADGIAFAGVEMPIGGQLVFDARRNALRQAQLLPEMAQAEQQKVANKLWLEAIKTYLSWQLAYFARTVQRDGLVLAQQRYQWVTARANVGEIAAIDTLEAYLEVQRRYLLALEADVDYAVAGNTLANFMWTPEGQPLDLPPGWVPEPFPAGQALAVPAAEDLAATADSLHPELQKLRLKQQQLEFERRFTFWQAMPTLQVGFRPLLVPTAGALDGYSFSTLQENYKFGLGFYIPLPGRKNIAKLGLARLKLQMNALDIDYVRLGIRTGIAAQHTRATQYALLAETQASLATNAETMRRAEQTRFEAGESSLFVLNTRERYVLETRLKLLQLREKQLKALAELYWEAGLNPVAGFGL